VVTNSRLCQQRGDLEGAARAVAKAAEMMRADAPAVVREEVVSQQINIALLQDNLPAAQQIFSQEMAFTRSDLSLAALSADERIPYPRCLLYISALRLVAAQAAKKAAGVETGAALEQAGRLLAMLLQRSYISLAIDTLLVRAQIHAARGDAHSSLDDVNAALDLAEPEGYISHFLIEGKPIAGALALLATAAIVFGAFGSFGQTDFKRLVAYSSVNHMGFVVLGIAAAALAAGTQNATLALNGAILQMFNHGLSAAGMFFLVGVIYERTHTRNLEEFGGLFPLVPVYGGILIFTSMASLGLPGLNGFISEFLVIRGTWPILTVYTAVSMLGLLMTGAYILKGIKKVLHGPLNEKWAHGEHRLTEINTREIIVMAPLMVLILVIGLWPAWILDVINKAVMVLF
jgi:hypothetical protein